MTRFGKIFFTSALAACTALTASCAGGSTETPVQTIAPATATLSQTESPAAATPTPVNPAVLEEPRDAKKWISQKEQANALLMTNEQIQKLNTEMRARCAALTDIAAFPSSMSGTALKKLIEESSGPSLPKFDANGAAITAEDLAEIKSNRNMESISETAVCRKGVTVQRTDIRALPTAREFYNQATVQDHDRMQESELAAASAVWILHTSSDGKFYFIQSYYYTGWVNAEFVADAEDNADWESYAKLLNLSENASKDLKFAVVTDSLLRVDDVKLDMGTALLLAEEPSKQVGMLRLILPGRDESGKLTRITAEISERSASVGYLPYTYRNLYIQAFKYAGTPYGWGGMKDGVDCSSYVLSVFKTFGLVFPRNTSQQNKTNGNITNVEGKSKAEMLDVLRKAEGPALIYQSGHVMLYLGEIDGTSYIIHAPGGGKVREDAYDGFSSLIRICEVAPLK